MERDDILREIYEKKIIEKVSSRYWSYLGSNQRDFVQYIYLLLCELPEDKLVQLYNDHQLDFYIISIVRNQARCDYNPFQRLYNDKRIDYMSNTQLTSSYEDYEEL